MGRRTLCACPRRPCWPPHPSAPTAPASAFRFEIPPPPGSVFPGANSTPRMAVSPDGRYVAFTINRRDGKPDQLWIRRLDSLVATELVTITDATNEPVQQPFWSPDSRFIGFFADGKLRKVDVSDGVVQTLCSVPGNQYGGTWNEDRTILFGSSETKGLPTRLGQRRRSLASHDPRRLVRRTGTPVAEVSSRWTPFPVPVPTTGVGPARDLRRLTG